MGNDTSTPVRCHTYAMYDDVECDSCLKKVDIGYGCGGPEGGMDVLTACESCLLDGFCPKALKKHRTKGHLVHHVYSAEELALVKIEPAFQCVLDYHGEHLDTSPMRKKPFVALIRSVIGQQVKFSQAQEIFARLASAGTDYDNIKPSALAEMDVKHLAIILRHKGKADIVSRVSKHIVENKIELCTPDDIMSLWKGDNAIKGIGQWTVVNTILTAWPAHDVFPCGDVFLQERIQKMLNLSSRPTTCETATITEKWAPYRGVAAWLLWRWFADTRYE